MANPDPIFSDRIADVPRSFIREILKVALDPSVISFAGGLPNRELFPVERLRCRCCFHFVTANRPGIWALVTGTLADNGINIESVHQKWEDRTLPSDLFVLVDEAEEGQLRTALARVSASPGISAESRYFRILDGGDGSA